MHQCHSSAISFESLGKHWRTCSAICNTVCDLHLTYLYFHFFLLPQLHYCLDLLCVLPGADDAVAPPAGKEDRLWSRQVRSLQEHLRCTVLFPHPHCAAGRGWRAALWVLLFCNYFSEHVCAGTAEQHDASCSFFFQIMLFLSSYSFCPWSH